MTWTSSMLAGWNLLIWSSRRWVSIAVVFLLAWASRSGHSVFLSNHVEQKASKKEFLFRLSKKRSHGLLQHRILSAFQCL